ncbi:hypothetical protein AB7M45_007832 [Bradyrhizobium elkanii]|uniref:hypothetical protein n=1 Tax=Bradyrhizobium elkanii TaxID=29448 RepID=UPI00091ADE6E|nr:hypothetical protein [Bradyrhizobium elkanii]MCW2195059.1 hypothetical protein [Bradyrhizobium elkanii]NWL67248.1 hypothetical protein [Bradyrhizobium elkanii]OIM94087.1 hypothetical protein BLN97_12500 [Bradyrhizobium elkanii]
MSTITIWTCTTEGDNCGTETTVHATEAAAVDYVRGSLRDILKRNPERLAAIEAATAENIAELWEDSVDGPCIIEEQAVALPPFAVAIYETRHGDETRLYPNSDAARAWRSEIAAENWAARMDEDKPADPDEVAEAYFERVGEMRGDFFRLEELEIVGGTVPVAPAQDWRQIARDLAAALDSCTHQIGQMRGMFSDEDGTISGAVSDAEDAAAAYRRAAAGLPPAPAPQFIGQDDRACAEGWGLFENSDTGKLEIQADAESSIFVCDGVSHDDEAEVFVKTQAAAGSEYHALALLRVGTAQ